MADELLAKLLVRIAEKIDAKSEEHVIRGNQLGHENRVQEATHEYMLAEIAKEISLAFRELALETMGDIPN